jgi:hypothetical protein
MEASSGMGRRVRRPQIILLHLTAAARWLSVRRLRSAFKFQVLSYKTYVYIVSLFSAWVLRDSIN